MKRPRASLVVLALLIAAAACTHHVTRPTTASQTAERMAGWPNRIQGLVLRSDSTVELARRDSVSVEGDSLIIRQTRMDRGNSRVDTIRIADVTHVKVSETHVGLTVAAAILIPIAVLGVVALVAIAAEDDPEPAPETSCPIIYAFDGVAYVAVAEPLGGAISAGLQRTDLSRLEGLALVNGEYQVLIANEMREVQYLDAFSLMAVDHPDGTTVINDRAGNLHVAAPTVAPVRAVSADGGDLLPALVAHDDQQWWAPGSSPAPFTGANERDTITLTFPRPAHSTARLVLHARTSRLGAHALKEMLDMWGGAVDHWYGLLDGSPVARSAHQEWVQREELWTLRVWVREAGAWVAQDAAVGGGPYLSELQSITLDLSRVQGETVELRLHPPRGYWDIDFTALDTTRAAAPTITHLSIGDADMLGDQDPRLLLRDADGSHMVMSERGEKIGLTFKATAPASGMTRTLFSRSTGYYRIETDRTGIRQAARLDSLWLQPGYAVKLAEQVHARQLQHAAR